MSNPFCIYTLPVDAPFCNREQEIKELVSFARSGTNVVLYSPRRYGKTSLVKKIQYNLKKQGDITVFADFFGVTSIDDVAARLAKSTFSVTYKSRSLWKTALQTIKSFRPVLKPDPESGVSLSVEPASASRRGIEVLSETMESLGHFIEGSGKPVHIALDEFQEIVELKEALQIEATMRRCKPIKIYRRYTEDLPPIEAPRVTGHAVHGYWCPKCRKVVFPTVTDALPKAMIGLRVVVFTAWLHYLVGVSVNNLVKMLAVFSSFKISPGGQPFLLSNRKKQMKPKHYHHLRQKLYDRLGQFLMAAYDDQDAKRLIKRLKRHKDELFTFQHTRGI